MFNAETAIAVYLDTDKRAKPGAGAHAFSRYREKGIAQELAEYRAAEISADWEHFNDISASYDSGADPFDLEDMWAEHESQHLCCAECTAEALRYAPEDARVFLANDPEAEYQAALASLRPQREEGPITPEREMFDWLNRKR